MFEIPELPARLDDVERCIDTALEGAAGLAGPSRRVADAGGKRLRPVLTIACAELGAVYDADVIAAAAATELVQVGSLVHDDLLDGAVTRRGTPTINAVEGPSTAIVAGDFILARAGELAAGIGAEAASILAATIVELCVGQSREMAELSNPDRTVEEHLASIRGKTAKLFSCACALGAVCADLPAEEAGALARYGEHFGMAFQILDDVLDLIGDPQRLGKPTGVDVATGVYTLPVLVALAEGGGQRLRDRLVAGDTAGAIGLVLGSSGIDTALGAAEGYADRAAVAATSLGDARAAPLAAFAHSYLSWALEAFVDRRAWPVR